MKVIANSKIELKISNNLSLFFKINVQSIQGTIAKLYERITGNYVQIMRLFRKDNDWCDKGNILVLREASTFKFVQQSIGSEEEAVEVETSFITNEILGTSV